MTIAQERKEEKMDDLISRQAAIDALERTKEKDPKGDIASFYNTITDNKIAVIEALPSAQSAIIRCKECRWWDKYDDYDNGYCMAAKHGYWSEHWDISIRRTYKGDFYCADAEPYKGD